MSGARRPDSGFLYEHVDTEDVTAPDVATLAQVVACMMSPVEGLALKTRRLKLRNIGKSFAGTEAVEWLEANQNMSKVAALTLCNQLVSGGFIYNPMAKEAFFKSSPSVFYCFTEKAKQRKKNVGNMHLRKLVDEKVPETPEEICLLLSDPVNGIDVKNRKYRLKSYKNCFVAADAVALVKLRAKTPTRAKATDLCQQLVDAGLIEHVCVPQPIKDAFLFFRFTDNAKKLRIAQCSSPLPTRRPKENTGKLSPAKEVEDCLLSSGVEGELFGGASKTVRCLSKSKAARRTATSIVGVVRMMNDDMTGVKVKSRKYHLRTYKECFVASDAIDWMLSNLGYRTREEGLAMGQALVDGCFIEHVVEAQPFKDEFLFFRFTSAAQGLRTPPSSARARDSEIRCLGDFEHLSQLGDGCGKLSLVRKKQSGKVYVMRALEECRIRSVQALKSSIEQKQELVNASPFHRHIHWTFQTDTHVYILTDFLPGGDLADHLLRKSYVTGEDVARFYVAEIALALNHIHQEGVAYDGLRLSKVLLDGQGHACLAEFGIEKAYFRSGGPAEHTAFVSPEVRLGQPSTPASDFYSLGIIMHQLITGKVPNELDDDSRVMSKHAKILLDHLLLAEPIDRCQSLSEMQHFAWLKGIEWKKMAMKKLPAPFQPSKRIHRQIASVTLEGERYTSKQEEMSSVELEDGEGDVTDVGAVVTGLASQKVVYSSDEKKLLAGNIYAVIDWAVFDQPCVDLVRGLFMEFHEHKTCKEMLLILKVLFNVRQAEWKRADGSIERFYALKCAIITAMREWTGLKNVSRNLSSSLFEGILSWMASEKFSSCDASAVQLNYIRAFAHRREAKKLDDLVARARASPVEAQAVSVATLTAKELASGLTMLCWSLFYKVRPRELLKGAWQKSDKRERSPYLSRLADQFNEVSFWVATTILTVTLEQGLEAAADVTSKLIKTAEELWLLRNFHSLAAVLAGLNQHSVSRVKALWSVVPENLVAMLDELNAVVSPARNYATYRQLVGQIEQEAMLPYVAVHLRDLAFIEDGNADSVLYDELWSTSSEAASGEATSNELINAEKLLMLGETKYCLLQHQVVPYTLSPSVGVLAFLSNIKPTDEDHIYELSISIQPISGAAPAHLKSPDVSETTSSVPSDPEMLPTNQWNPQHVCRWLEANDFPSLVPIFQNVNGMSLVSLQYDDLQRMGIDEETCRELLRCIDLLNEWLSGTATADISISEDPFTMSRESSNSSMQGWSKVKDLSWASLEKALDVQLAPPATSDVRDTARARRMHTIDSGGDSGSGALDGLVPRLHLAASAQIPAVGRTRSRSSKRRKLSAKVSRHHKSSTPNF